MIVQPETAAHERFAPIRLRFRVHHLIIVTTIACILLGFPGFRWIAYLLLIWAANVVFIFGFPMFVQWIIFRLIPPLRRLMDADESEVPAIAPACSDENQPNHANGA